MCHLGSFATSACGPSKYILCFDRGASDSRRSRCREIPTSNGRTAPSLSFTTSNRASCSVACAPQLSISSNRRRTQSPSPRTNPRRRVFWARQRFRIPSSDMPCPTPGWWRRRIPLELEGASVHRQQAPLLLRPVRTHGGWAHGNIGRRPSDSPNLRNVFRGVAAAAASRSGSPDGTWPSQPAATAPGAQVLTTSCQWLHPPYQDHPTIRGRCRHGSIHTVRPRSPARPLGFSVSRFLRSPHCPTGKRTSD